MQQTNPFYLVSDEKLCTMGTLSAYKTLIRISFGSFQIWHQQHKQLRLIRFQAMRDTLLQVKLENAFTSPRIQAKRNEVH